MDDKEVLKRLLDAASCNICFNRLSPNIICCTSGHAICGECRRKISGTCPTCRNPFSENQTISFSKVLAALPSHCKYRGCMEIKCEITEHEQYCGFRPTNCRLCDWKGPVMEVREHVSSTHSLVGNKGNYYLKEFIFYKTFKEGAIINDQFFWRTSVIDPDKQLFFVQFTCIPTKQVEETVFITVQFKLGKAINMIRKKICFLEGSTIKNKFSFNADMIEPFVDNVGCLPYEVIIEKGQKHDN